MESTRYILRSPQYEYEAGSLSNIHWWHGFSECMYGIRHTSIFFWVSVILWWFTNCFQHACVYEHIFPIRNSWQARQIKWTGDKNVVVCQNMMRATTIMRWICKIACPCPYIWVSNAVTTQGVCLKPVCDGKFRYIFYDNIWILNTCTFRTESAGVYAWKFGLAKQDLFKESLFSRGNCNAIQLNEEEKIAQMYAEACCGFCRYYFTVLVVVDAGAIDPAVCGNFFRGRA